jgi:hypothetical protein
MLIELTTPTTAKTVIGTAKIQRPMLPVPKRSPTVRNSTPAPPIMMAEATIWIANLSRGDTSVTSSQRPTAMMTDRARRK